MRITVIPGDGIGPAITEATLRVLDKVGSGLDYEMHDAGECALQGQGELLPSSTLASIERNRVALKGPLMTPVGTGFSSVNVALRRRFELYANVRPVESFPGVATRYPNVNLTIVRENTEGLYIGRERYLNEAHTEAEAIALVTQEGSRRVIDAAFEVAEGGGRTKVCVLHKANILKLTSGLFLQTFRERAERHPKIQSSDMIIDNACMQLVMRPEQFEVIVTTNLFGDIVSDLCAGLVGGLGLAPSANIGKQAALFEAVHGSAPDIAGKNVANPTALILAAALMLEHLGQLENAGRIRRAVRELLSERERCTRDLGGNATTTQFTEDLIARL